MTGLERAELVELRKEMRELFSETNSKLDHWGARVIQLEVAHAVRTELEKERNKVGEGQSRTIRWWIERSLQALGLVFVVVQLAGERIA